MTVGGRVEVVPPVVAVDAGGLAGWSEVELLLLLTSFVLLLYH